VAFVKIKPLFGFIHCFRLDAAARGEMVLKNTFAIFIFSALSIFRKQLVPFAWKDGGKHAALRLTDRHINSGER
jgi:hypothetical protein